MCRLAELGVMHIMGSWHCNLNTERASDLPRFERRWDASGIVPICNDIQNQT